MQQSGFSQQGIVIAVVVAVLGLGGLMLLRGGDDPATASAPERAGVATPAESAAPADASGASAAPAAAASPPADAVVPTSAAAAGSAAATPAAATADPSTTASKAQNNALNAMSQAEACFTDTQDYTLCTTADQLGNTGLALVSGSSPAPGEVAILAGSRDSFMIRAADAQGQLWQLVRGSATDTTIDHVCMLPDESNFCPTQSW